MRGKSCRAQHSSAYDFDEITKEENIELEVVEVSWEIPIFRGLEKEKDPAKKTKIGGKSGMNDFLEVCG